MSSSMPSAHLLFKLLLPTFGITSDFSGNNYQSDKNVSVHHVREGKSYSVAFFLLQEAPDRGQAQVTMT